MKQLQQAVIGFGTQGKARAEAIIALIRKHPPFYNHHVTN